MSLQNVRLEAGGALAVSAGKDECHFYRPVLEAAGAVGMLEAVEAENCAYVCLSI